MAEQQAETREQQFARVRAYLLAQGEKLSPAEIVEKVRESQGTVLAAAGRVPAARLGKAPAAGEWSVAEVLQHVIGSGAGVGRRIVETVEQRQAAPALFEDRLEHNGADLSLARARELLLAEREALFAAAVAADPAAHLDQAAIEHQWFGPLNWKAALLFLRVHDLDHARQIDAIAAQGA
ncbi:MAG TPA: DinB family protein [Dehalococcoidia bacterium]|nr:DinB family protein [Dehalococcoidia bacterium]